MNKIKKIVTSLVGVVVLIFLGFIPNSTKSVFAIYWGDLGAKMIDAGVIDREKIENLYQERGGMSDTEKEIIYGKRNGHIIITPENSGMMLNMLWAFGLANENSILESGPMMDTKYEGAENFASTGGWTLAKGSAMNHYSMHSFITLSQEQQVLVEQVAKNIFRPCCKNSTYFPDCNHGMAMLGLLELMALDNATEKEMYDIAEKVNGYWFPEVKTTGCEI